MSDFWLSIVGCKNAMHLKKISEELMPVVWHPKRGGICVSEDKKKEKELEIEKEKEIVQNVLISNTYN